MRGRPVSVPVEGGEIGGCVEVAPDAGHFPWMDQPGCVRAGMARLVTA
jgi:hypothetical protein